MLRLVFEDMDIESLDSGVESSESGVGKLITSPRKLTSSRSNLSYISFQPQFRLHLGEVLDDLHNFSQSSQSLTAGKAGLRMLHEIQN